MRHLPSRTSSWVLSASAAVTATLLILVGCADEPTHKTLYAPPPRGMLVEGQQATIDLRQSAEVANERSSGCIHCHKEARDPHRATGTFHISCVDCHGGDGLEMEDKTRAHPQPHDPSLLTEGGRNPERSYMNFMVEDWDYVRFVNPGDLRVASVTCSPCHENHVFNVKKSLMTHVASFWGVAGYANGIVSPKRSILGESYSDRGIPQLGRQLLPKDPSKPRTTDNWREPTDEELERYSLVKLIAPLPHWEITQTGNIYRVFEQGSRLGGPALGFNGAPTPPIGLPDKGEDAGRPNNRFSDRGLGTLNRVDLPILNVQKTRLNDPHLSFLGTNDQPGDFRSSGCSACHMIYANDRSPTHSGPYAKFGNMGHKGEMPGADPTIPAGQPGHPIEHTFTSAIPSSTCMVCHHHQPNSFVNSFYGFTMWTYDADGELLFPKEHKEETHEEFVEGLYRNPEEAARRGIWGDVDRLENIAVEVNPKAKHTQFADYHGHGWMFRAAFKMDRKGNLLDADGKIIPYDDPDKFKGVHPLEGVPGDFFKKAPDHARRAVHLADIHAEKGMHCVDCHFTYDVHGDGNLYAEYAAAVEIRCQDCHGTALARATFEVSGPASKTPGHFSIESAPDKSLFNHVTPDGKPQFEQLEDGRVVQRSMVEPGKSWIVTQIRDVSDPTRKRAEGEKPYSDLAAYYHTIRKDNRTYGNVGSARPEDLAHQDDRVECFACHTSWITACFGCHLPQRANMKTPMNHFEKKELRNFATYNPQVVRDAEFLLGVSANVKGNTFAPVRSSSAVLISSEDAQRRRIYGSIPTTAASGMSSQIFNTHLPHTVRKTETRQCEDCHLSAKNDNNAWLAQTYLLGTNQVNYMGHLAWVGAGDGGVWGVGITEYEEPQAVLGSDLHRFAYPDEYKKFVDGGRVIEKYETHHGHDVRSLQLRGEYLYCACGEGGVEVFDVANVFNKDFSEKIVTSPVSPLGQDTHVPTAYATAVAFETSNYTSMARLYRPENKEQGYEYEGKMQNMHESYRYLYVSDRVEGLVIVDVDCLTDGDPQNNFIEKVLSFNPGGALDGAENLAVAGATVYVCCDRGLVAVDISDPRRPRIIAEVGAPYVVKPVSVAVQFRYAFVCDQEGLKVLDVTLPEQMSAVANARVSIRDARDVYVAKTYGYVAAGAEGLVIVDLEVPTDPKVDRIWNADGQIDDLNQVKVAMTNDSVYAYLADGKNGLRVASLVTPEDGGRSPYGFAPRPMPKLIAGRPTTHPALAISKGLDRDRAVDESGHQMAAFGRIGGRPMTLQEMRKLFLRDGRPYTVSNRPTAPTRQDAAPSPGVTGTDH